MTINAKDYDPALMQGANIGVAVDLTDIVDNNGNEVIEIDGVSSAVNYLRVTNAATTNAVVISSQGDDTNIGLTINSLLTGALTLDSTSTGAVNLGTGAFAKTITIGNVTGATAIAIKSGTGGTVVTSADADALTVGANGATNPVLKIDASTASVATGISITGAAAAGGVALAVLSSGTNEALTIDAKGSGTITLAGTSTGQVTVAEGSGNLKAKGLTISDGGTVTQATGITTGVTLNTTTGQITTVTAPSIAAGAEATFTVTNSTVAATSIVLVSVATQFSDGLVNAFVSAVGAGSFNITLTNVDAAAVSAGAAVINFAVFGGSAT